MQMMERRLQLIIKLIMVESSIHLHIILTAEILDYGSLITDKKAHYAHLRAQNIKPKKNIKMCGMCGRHQKVINYGRCKKGLKCQQGGLVQGVPKRCLKKNHNINNFFSVCPDGK